MDVMFSRDAFEEYQSWQKEDKKTLIRINNLIEDIIRNGNDGIGKPEPLKGKYQGFYSRRIDDKNRLVYRISENHVIIISCKSHYGEK